MAAPEGNQFWKLRNKHGRPRLWESAEELWGAACDYFEWVDKNPWHEVKAMTVNKGDGMGSEIVQEELPKKMPYTLKELCLFLGCSESYLRAFKSTIEYSKLSVEEAKAFLTVISDIEEICFTQQFKGATAGFFNGNIISRALGLVDKQDLTSKGKEIKPKQAFTVKVVRPQQDE